MKGSSMRFTQLIAVTVIAPTILMLVGCGEGSTDDAASSSTSDAAWVLTSEPADATPVSEIKASAAEGDQVTMRGRIGGRMEPMSPGSPVFTVVDLAVPHCGEIPGDNCPAPWDYCCEPRESMTANTATIQLVGSDGLPLDTSPAEHGFEPLDEVVIVGVVAARPDERVLTIRATGVHRVQ